MRNFYVPVPVRVTLHYREYVQKNKLRGDIQSS